jgi:Tol biopolymer transport system component
VAFVTRNETERLWAWPFDAANQRVTADGQPVTKPTGIGAFDLSADGRWLLFVVRRPGKDSVELWIRSFDNGTETMLGEGPHYFSPRLSRDGSLVAYRTVRHDTNPPERRLAWMARDGRAEGMLGQGIFNPLDWSADGARLLHSCPPPAVGGALCSSPREATTPAESRVLIAEPGHQFWQGRFSPDGRWILFNAQSRKVAGVSVLGVMPSSGGKWTPLTDARLWADKGRWSPDGRTIYFISNRNGAFFDVWGIRFDPDSGRAIGEEFRVTRNDSPGRTVEASGASELGVSSTRIVVPIVEAKGSVWLLDGVSR